jgi:hypothetical protein
MWILVYGFHSRPNLKSSLFKMVNRRKILKYFTNDDSPLFWDTKTRPCIISCNSDCQNDELFVVKWNTVFVCSTHRLRAACWRTAFTDHSLSSPGTWKDSQVRRDASKFTIWLSGLAPESLALRLGKPPYADSKCRQDRFVHVFFH